MVFWGTRILLPKLLLPTVRKNCYSDREFFLKFKVEGREFTKNLRSLEQFIQTVKGQNNFWLQNAFFTCSWRFLISKGQIISEGNYLVLNSSKKRTSFLVCRLKF